MMSARPLRYAVIFVPPALLAGGQAFHANWLLPAGFFVALPLLRLVFGSVPLGGTSPWTTADRRVLDWLPRIYAVLFAITMACVLCVATLQPPASPLDCTGFVVSVLVLACLAACVAHDLGHRPLAGDRRAAHLISAIAGYPFFIFEHWAHHAHARDTASAHCPRLDESVWAYALRRGRAVPRQAFAISADCNRTDGLGGVFDDARFYVCLTGVLWIMFGALAGLYGFCLYAVLVLGVPLLLNTITYIQHWGLGDDCPAKLGNVRQLGWDDRSRLQAWLILGISFHHQHHEVPGRPYYTYGPTQGAPMLPAEYAVLVLACLVPPVWRRVMKPVLTSWCASQRHSDA